MPIDLKRTFLILALAVSTTACATAYGELGGLMDDGVAADRLSADVFRIRSRGNEMSEPGLIEDYAMLRAAETVRMACMTHFVVLDGADRTEVSETVHPESWSKTVEEKVVDGKKQKVVTRQYTPGYTSTSVRPGQDLVVRGLKLAAGQRAPEEAIAADEVLTFVGSRVKRKKNSPPPVFPICEQA
jgi:hypothetical protein